MIRVGPEDVYKMLTVFTAGWKKKTDFVVYNSTPFHYDVNAS